MHAALLDYACLLSLGRLRWMIDDGSVHWFVSDYFAGKKGRLSVNV